MTAPLVIGALIIVILAILAMVRVQAKGSRPDDPAVTPTSAFPGMIETIPTTPVTLPPMDAAYRSLMNDWQVRAQPNDKQPRIAEMAPDQGRGSTGRADTRRSLQSGQKEWARNRHD